MKSTISCLSVFYIGLFDCDLDADDNNSLLSEFSENDDSEIDVVDTSGMDEDWRLITVTTAQADEFCISLDKLIRSSVLYQKKEYSTNTLTLFFPMFAFDPPENIKKPLVF